MHFKFINKRYAKEYNKNKTHSLNKFSIMYSLALNIETCYYKC